MCVAIAVDMTLACAPRSWTFQHVSIKSQAWKEKEREREREREREGESERETTLFSTCYILIKMECVWLFLPFVSPTYVFIKYSLSGGILSL